MNEKIEPRQGGLYLPKFTLQPKRKWTGYGIYALQIKYKTKEKPFLDFFDPETGLIFEKQEKFLETPLLFLKKRYVRACLGHTQMEHLDDYDMVCFGDEVNIGLPGHGLPNQWDENRHTSADVFYDYWFLFENIVVAVSITVNKSFGDFFHEATGRETIHYCLL